MKLPAFRNTPAIIIATGALLLSATGGAVAAGLITGADIKNGTVTGADIKNGTVTTKDIKNETLTLGDISAGAEGALRGATGPAGPAGADGVSGWVTVTVLSDSIATDAHGSVVVDCPAGKRLTGGIVDWSEGYGPVSMRHRFDYSMRAYGTNTRGAPDTLVATIYCATVS